MKTLLRAVALVCFLHVVMMGKLTTTVAPEVPTDDETDDRTTLDDQELEKALQEIMENREDDQELQVSLSKLCSSPAQQFKRGSEEVPKCHFFKKMR